MMSPADRPPSDRPHGDPRHVIADDGDAGESERLAVIALMEAGDMQGAATMLADLHPSDVADLLEQADDERRVELVALLRPSFDAEILAYLSVDLREEVVEQLEPKALAAAVAELDTDDAIDVIQDLDEEAQAEILSNLPPEARALVEEGLTYPEFSAGRLMGREFVSVPEFWTVGGLLDYLRAAATADDSHVPEQFYDIFIVDPMHRVVGTVPLSRVLRARRGVKLNEILHEDIHRIPATMDQEEVARLFRNYGLVSAPVVDKGGRLLGVITVDDVVDVIEEEAEADMLAMGGVGEDDFYRAVLATARSRFRWLAVNVVTALLAAMVINLFSVTISHLVALAVLMPIVASMGGNAGTQTLTVAVRALATKELTPANATRVIGKEVLVGLLNGCALAGIIGVIAYIWFGQPLLGVVIACAMVVNLFCAGLFGALIPFVLDRMRVDPAVASGVFLTTVTDVVGFLAFLGLATLMLL
ncbi:MULTISPECIES: magnesium transporter [unclassified Azospirillum]|uniref:magnesium transporter n=1 Tax=unclassified Azospirillum TaxID=2630922 RepID=UPI000B784EF0|nr:MULTISPECIES: magnesium transporter [unclassified Azospirillum]